MESKKNQTAFELVWANDKLSVEEKIEILDDITEKLPTEVRKKYRIWRFKQVKGKVIIFSVQNQSFLLELVNLGS